MQFKWIFIELYHSHTSKNRRRKTVSFNTYEKRNLGSGKHTYDRLAATWNLNKFSLLNIRKPLLAFEIKSREMCIFRDLWKKAYIWKLKRHRDIIAISRCSRMSSIRRNCTVNNNVGHDSRNYFLTNSRFVNFSWRREYEPSEPPKASEYNGNMARGRHKHHSKHKTEHRRKIRLHVLLAMPFRRHASVGMGHLKRSQRHQVTLGSVKRPPGTQKSKRA